VSTAARDHARQARARRYTRPFTWVSIIASQSSRLADCAGSSPSPKARRFHEHVDRGPGSGQRIHERLAARAALAHVERSREHRVAGSCASSSSRSWRRPVGSRDAARDERTRDLGPNRRWPGEEDRHLLMPSSIPRHVLSIERGMTTSRRPTNAISLRSGTSSIHGPELRNPLGVIGRRLHLLSRISIAAMSACRSTSRASATRCGARRSSSRPCSSRRRSAAAARGRRRRSARSRRCSPSSRTRRRAAVARGLAELPPCRRPRQLPQLPPQPRRQPGARRVAARESRRRALDADTIVSPSKIRPGSRTPRTSFKSLSSRQPGGTGRPRARASLRRAPWGELRYERASLGARSCCGTTGLAVSPAQVATRRRRCCDRSPQRRRDGAGHAVDVIDRRSTAHRAAQKPRKVPPFHAATPHACACPRSSASR